MNPYAPLVHAYDKAFRDSRSLPLGGIPPIEHPPLATTAPKGLIFSPHPDDECIIGLLPLRLRIESGWNIVNVAVTQGSNRSRQAERLAELQQACHYIGFGLIQTASGGLENVTSHCRNHSPSAWIPMVERIATLLETEKPNAIFVPHLNDWNGTHIGTHLLVMDALATLGPAFSTHLVETEYWGQMTQPNLMVEASVDLVAQQVAGTSFHAGEVSRNPFHLLLPAWMQDAVRRGSELVGGQGGAAPNYSFATLYRHRIWKDGHGKDLTANGVNLPLTKLAGSLFAA